MLTGNKGHLKDGISLRPARPSDDPFLAILFRATRKELQMIDAEQGFIEALLDQQHEAQQQGYGDQFPEAMYFIVEKLSEPIGKLTLDFGSNEVRVVDLAMLPAARGKGYGTSVLRGVQKAAAMSGAPVTLTVLTSNVGALQLYARLGFRLEQTGDLYHLLSWYPTAEFMRQI